MTLNTGVAEVNDPSADPSQAARREPERPAGNFWLKSSPGLRAILQLDSRQPQPEVNRRVFGACVMWPPVSSEGRPLPFPPAGVEAVRSFLSGGSARYWARLTPGWPDWWLPWRDAVAPADEYIFADWVQHEDAPIHYQDEGQHNLLPTQTPAAFGDFVHRLNRTPWPGHPAGLGIRNWELWNEPIFPRAGAWEPLAHARFCVDAARRMKAADPDIRVGPHIYHDSGWNQAFLAELARRGGELIDFVVNHYYDTKWFQQWDTYGSYLGRVAYAEEIRRQIRRDQALLARHGDGRWDLVCTEWNNHPQRYDWPGDSTRDLAVALFQAGTLMAFMEEGVAAAQVFALRSESFGLFADPEAARRFPTYHVFDLFGRYCRGRRVAATVSTPRFVWQWEAPKNPEQAGPIHEIPYLSALACRQGPELNLFLLNRHQAETLCLRVKGDAGLDLSGPVDLTVLSGDTAEATEARLTVRRADPAGTTPELSLPPHSLTVARLRSSDL